MKFIDWLRDYSIVLVPVAAVSSLIYFLLEPRAATPVQTGPTAAAFSDPNDPTAAFRAWLGDDLPSSRLRKHRQ